MARDPNNLIHTNFNLVEKEVKKFDQVPDFETEDYDLNNPKHFKLYINDIKNIIRHSFEYQSYMSYLRQYADMNRCTFFKNVTNIDTFKIKIEIHHEPLTLFDIIMTVFAKRSAFREDLSPFMIAKEVMYLHYKLYVGLIPLSETVHELVHNQYIFVPTYAVFGQYKKFIEMYKQYMEPELLSTLSKIEAVSENYNLDDVEALLSTRMIAIDSTGANRMPNKEDTIDYIKSQLSQLQHPQMN